MFHREVVGVERASNLDLFFSGEAGVRALLAERSGGTELALLEGVMGFYDGVACSLEASSYAVAKATGTPVLLVVDCRGMAASIAAQVKGFTAFRPDSGVRAVLLNRLPPSLYPEVKALVEGSCGLPVAGYLPRMDGCALESRHLGLVTAGEVADLGDRLDRLAARLEKTVDLDLLLRLAGEAPPLAYEPPVYPAVSGAPLVAVARDAAFCFYYEEALELLEELGARLAFFSPLEDGGLPPGADALWLGGGYPELHARALAENAPMRRAVAAAVRGGMPTVAECGGFLYLHRTLRDAERGEWPMAGVLDAEAFPAGRLGRFGYASLTARRENLLCGAGETLPAHEFHYWESGAPGADFWAQKPLRETGWDCVHANERLYAGFPHLYFPAIPEAASRLLDAALRYRKECKR